MRTGLDSTGDHTDEAVFSSCRSPTSAIVMGNNQVTAISQPVDPLGDGAVCSLLGRMRDTDQVSDPVHPGR